LMKILLLFISFLMLVSCKPLVGGKRTVTFPGLPEAWAALAGERLVWQVRWVGPDGGVRQAETAASSLDLELLEEWPAAVCAWPSFPGKGPGLRPGILKPAGAVLPRDSLKGAVRLCWECGPDAFLYFALADKGSLKRSPALFNWQRLRGLFEADGSGGGTAALPEELCADPWKASWEDIAARTASSGWSTSSIKSSAKQKPSVRLSLPAEAPQDVLWFGSSPFMEPFEWRENEAVTVKLVSSPEYLFCEEGFLKITENAAMWYEW
jgi:hypothetical protein